MDRADCAPMAWLESEHYRRYHALDRMGFAWEFLRRNPSYRSVARALSHDRPSGRLAVISGVHREAARWGLVFR